MEGSGDGEGRTDGSGVNGRERKRRRGSDGCESEGEDGAVVGEGRRRLKRRRLDVRVPQVVVSEGVKVVREVLDGLVEVLDGEGEGGGEGR